jgi:hypothetical protein
MKKDVDIDFIYPHFIFITKFSIIQVEVLIRITSVILSFNFGIRNLVILCILMRQRIRKLSIVLAFILNFIKMVLLLLNI